MTRPDDDGPVGTVTWPEIAFGFASSTMGFATAFWLLSSGGAFLNTLGIIDLMGSMIFFCMVLVIAIRKRKTDRSGGEKRG